MENQYDRELAAFAGALTELHVAQGAPSLAKIEQQAPRARPLSQSAVSEAFSGRRLPSIDFVVALVQTLLMLGDPDSRKVPRDDPRVEGWRVRWKQVKLLQIQERRAQSVDRGTESAEAAGKAATEKDNAPPAASSTAQAADASAGGGSRPGNGMLSRSELPMMQKRIFRWATAYYETIAELVKKYPDPGQVLPRFLLPHPRQVRLVIAPRAISVISYESAEPWRADWVDDVDFENELPVQAMPPVGGLGSGRSRLRVIAVQVHYMDETFPAPSPDLWEKLILSGANAARYWTPDQGRIEANNDVLRACREITRRFLECGILVCYGRR